MSCMVVLINDINSIMLFCRLYIMASIFDSLIYSEFMVFWRLIILVRARLGVRRWRFSVVCLCSLGWGRQSRTMHCTLQCTNWQEYWNCGGVSASFFPGYVFGCWAVCRCVEIDLHKLRIQCALYSEIRCDQILDSSYIVRYSCAYVTLLLWF